MHQVDEATFCQRFSGELAALVLGLIQLHVEISQHDGVLKPEARQVLLYIREMCQRGWKEVCSNNRNPGHVCEDLAACHVRPVEAHQFKDPSRQPVTRYQAHDSLISDGTSGPSR